MDATPENLADQLLAGRYRVGGELGRGGMSIVLRAEDLRLSRAVALKVIQRSGASELTERLFREARAAARAQHPAVVTVFEYGTDAASGLDYLVMELLEGEPLDARLRRSGPLACKHAVGLALEIADALSHVHETGVVHRDLKPSNVFLARLGRRVDQLKLLDFGVAKQCDLHSLTETGQSVGTVAYMAPEQIVDAKRVDARTDIYALGVVLYETLTGQLPYPCRTVGELARRAVFEDGPDLAAGAIPTPLLPIIQRCLRRVPSARYPSARELWGALADLQLRGLGR